MKDALSFDEKFIGKVFQKYQKTKIILQQQMGLNELKEKTILYGTDTINVSQMIDYENYVKTIETILSLMPKAEYTCLIKEFLTIDDKNWWKKDYSQDTYQKLKYKAITRFLYLFLV